MGFLDDVQSTIDKGTAAATRATRAVQLKAQLADAAKRREGACAQLGAALYSRLKDDAAAREGLEQLFDGVAAIDAESAQCQAQIDQLEAEAAAEKEAVATARQQAWAQGYDCPFCGSRVGENDRFCASCGKPADEMRAAIAASQAAAQAAAAPGATCPSCGASVSSNDSFCMNCGARIEKPAVLVEIVAPAESVNADSAQAVEPAAVPDSPAAGSVPAANICPNCGAPTDPAFAFCMSCGHPLK